MSVLAFAVIVCLLPDKRRCLLWHRSYANSTSWEGKMRMVKKLECIVLPGFLSTPQPFPRACLVLP